MENANKQALFVCDLCGKREKSKKVVPKGWRTYYLGHGKQLIKCPRHPN